MRLFPTSLLGVGGHLGRRLIHWIVGTPSNKTLYIGSNSALTCCDHTPSGVLVRTKNILNSEYIQVPPRSVLHTHVLLYLPLCTYHLVCGACVIYACALRWKYLAVRVRTYYTRKVTPVERVLVLIVQNIRHYPAGTTSAKSVQ